jgi:DNA-binding CsgD family transcriptional regulator
MPTRADPDDTDLRAEVASAVVGAALQTVLTAFRAPALVIGRRGEIVCANEAGRVLVGGRLQAPELSGPQWEVRALAGAGARDWSLVVWRGETAQSAPARRGWKLTPRQREVLALIARGLSNAGIAESLGIRPGTVEFHVSALFDKVGVNSRAALLATVMKK